MLIIFPLGLVIGLVSVLLGLTDFDGGAFQG